MSRRWYRPYGFFPRSKPRKTRGGIKAQAKRGTFGGSWWTRRWIAVLEGFHVGARLGRGRSYARRGQVLSIRIDKGRVTAKVQGSRSRPYDIVIKVKSLSAAQWKHLAKVLSGQALFAAKLLAAEMPQDIEVAFEDAGLSLFPERSRDLATDCSCPDWSNPCKHIAAVYYLLGEEFDRDPFLLFKLRGMRREEVIGLLDQDGGRILRARRSRPAAAEPPRDAAPAPEPLTLDAAAFWNGPSDGRVPRDLFGEVQVPAMPAALPRRLGSFPFWRSDEPFLETIEPIYRKASSVGMDVFLGQPPRS
jgi:uncharacterized Zn finger protein